MPDKPFQDDSEDQDVKDCRELLRSMSELAKHLDTADLLCARYYHGQHWAKDSGTSPFTPQTTKSAKKIRTVANMIAPNVDQWKGRLQVNDWWARFQPDAHHAHTADLTLQLTTRQKQAWWNQFFPYANISGWQREANLRRLVLPSGGWGTYCFDEYAPGGVRLQNISRLTLDPANTSPDLEQHEKYVDSRVLTMEEFERTRYAAMLKKRGVHVETGVNVADLKCRESYLGMNLFNVQPGAHSTKSTGLIVHLYWRREKGELRRMVMVEVVKPKDKDGKEYDGVGWFKVEDKTWLYGTAYRYWRCHDIIGSAFSGSLVGRGISQQDVVSLVLAGQMYDLLNVVRKIVIQEGTIANMRELESSQRWGIVKVKKGAIARQALQPAVLEGARRDPHAEGLLNQALGFLKHGMSVQDPMLGVPVQSGRRPHSETVELIQQAATPIADIGMRDLQEDDIFFSRVARAAVLHWGKTRPEKLISYIGKRNASIVPARDGTNRTTLQVAMKVLEKNEGVCFLSREGHSTDPPEAVIARLETQFVAGHLTKWEYDWEVFLRTGQQAQAGQEVSLHNAEIMLYEILHGQREPEDIRAEDNHILLLYLIHRQYDRRVLDAYDEDALDRLSMASLECKRHLFENGQMDEAVASLGEKFGAMPSEAQGAQTPGPTGPGGGAPEEMSAAVASPAVGEALAAAG